VIPRREQLARAAGIYNGEGGIYCYDRPKTYICLKIGQNNCQYEPVGAPSILAQFREAIGMGRIAGPYQHPNSRWPTWTLLLSQDESVAAYEMLRPWLSVAKRAQGDAAVARWRAIGRQFKRGTATEYPCGHPRTPENTNGGTTCRECHRLRSERRNRRIAAERAARRPQELSP
jgi:hypothetical protein